MVVNRPFYVRATIVALFVIAVASVIPTVVQGLEGVEGFLFNIIAIVLSLVFGGLICRYGGWLLWVAPLLGAGAWLLFSVTLSYDSDGLKTFFDFAPAIVILAAGLVAFVCGPVAFFLGRRPNPRTAATLPEQAGFGTLAVVVAALVIASGIVSIVGRDSVSASERAAAFQTVEMKGTEFIPLELELPAGQPLRVVVENRDLIVHTFTVDELDIEYILGGRSEKLMELPAIPAGTYEYACKVPGTRT